MDGHRDDESDGKRENDGHKLQIANIIVMKTSVTWIQGREDDSGLVGRLGSGGEGMRGLRRQHPSSLCCVCVLGFGIKARHEGNGLVPKLGKSAFFLLKKNSCSI